MAGYLGECRPIHFMVHTARFQFGASVVIQVLVLPLVVSNSATDWERMQLEMSHVYMDLCIKVSDYKSNKTPQNHEHLKTLDNWGPGSGNLGTFWGQFAPHKLESAWVKPPVLLIPTLRIERATRAATVTTRAFIIIISSSSSSMMNMNMIIVISIAIIIAIIIAIVIKAEHSGPPPLAPNMLHLELLLTGPLLSQRPSPKSSSP